jgi:hypothetical protein
MNVHRRSYRWLFWILALFLLSAGACRAVGGPSFTNHSAPQADLEFSAFEEAGCPGEPNRRRACQEDSPLRALGCHELREPSALLALLEPEYPIIYCVLHPSTEPGNPINEIERLLEEGSYIKALGGLDPLFFRYAIVREGSYQVLETEADFQAVYAPVESPEEALAYSLALTNLRAYFGLARDPELEYFVNQIEDTHVETVAGGYLVHLFAYREFGCGPHPTYAVAMQVGSDGTLEEIERREVFKDPTEDNLCVD